jgi:cystathionine beta-lyase/cystathionine gamma-synthase
MDDEPDWSEAATILAHDPRFAEGSVVPPLYQTSLFTFETYAHMRETFAGRTRQSVYSRVGNPTTAVFEDKLARLEGAEAARAFASGMAAISGAVLSQVQSGDRVVCVRHVYPDAYRFFEVLLPRMGVRVDYVDGRDCDAVGQALRGARVLYLESPTSWVFEVQELGRLTALARREGVTTIIDNSWASPIFQRPLAHGADLVLHSASKYLGGHSDTVAGVVAGSKALIAKINELTHPFLGAKLSPLEAFLLTRGLRTLPFRLKRHMESALLIAERLRAEAHVTKIHHPVYSNHPGRATLSGFTGLFTFEVDEAIDIPRFADLVKFFRLGVSWGGHESLVVPVAASLAQTPGVNSFDRFNVSPRAIRLHVGLEDAEMLWADLQNALAKSVKS